MLILLQLGGVWSVVAYVRRGGCSAGVRHGGIFGPILHRRAFFLFALHAAHCPALPGQTGDLTSEDRGLCDDT